MNIVRYSLQGADMAGAKEHPRKVMNSLGVKILKWEVVPVADAIFMELDKMPKPLPNYLTPVYWKFTKVYESGI